MSHNDLSSKLTQVIEQIPKDVFYDFCCSYAQENPNKAFRRMFERIGVIK